MRERLHNRRLAGARRSDRQTKPFASNSAIGANRSKMVTSHSLMPGSLPRSVPMRLRNAFADAESGTEGLPESDIGRRFRRESEHATKGSAWQP